MKAMVFMVWTTAVTVVTHLRPIYVVLSSITGVFVVLPGVTCGSYRLIVNVVDKTVL